MSLVVLDNISLQFSDQPILRNADLTIDNNERICLIGRNGAGKSTLLRIITGEQQPDSGEIRYRHALRISQLIQALPDELDQSVHRFVSAGLAHLEELIGKYKVQSEQSLDARGLRQLDELHHLIEAEGGWNIDQRVATVLSELGLPEHRTLNELSGGWQRRAGLARALVCNPELLLLDEPTNHLDLATIQWLEDRIRGFNGSVLFITHDRVFLQGLATRIVEIDRTRLTSWPGDYANFLRRKQQALHAEDIDKSRFEKKLAEEEQWIRQGIKARRTRNEGRVRTLYALRQEQEQRHKLKREPRARIHIEGSEAEAGRKVIEMHNVSYGYGADVLIDRLSLKIMRGDRIGLIGNNGVGKSTLLNLMLGRLQPRKGTVKLGTNLEIGYFDQMRRHLDPDKTIADIVGEGRDYIRLNGKERHVIGYLRGFLFSAKRAKTPIKALSGGERNRVILARLFTRPSNLLVLDEPTNDLDIETLEVLEDRLVEYQGTLIIVSHDREFLDNVITSTLVFEEGGVIRRYAGGYSDWLARGKHLIERDNPQAKDNNRGSDGDEKKRGNTPGKLSYKLKLELEALPRRIETLENDIDAVQNQISDLGFYAQDYQKVQAVLDVLGEKQRELERIMARWLELESR
jgi:ATP-binding cassette subfamily F protein uup